MLHRVNEAGCGAGLLRLVDLQRTILALACEGGYRPPPQERAILDRFGAAGEWVWERLWYNRDPAQGASELQDRLNEAAAHIDKHPGLGDEILRAFDHDLQFGSSTDDAVFAFAFRTLHDPATRISVGALAKLFYDLLSGGIPAGVHGGPSKLSIRSFKELFWEANQHLRACPACDRAKPDEIRGKDASDADHFFPRSLYPFLSVHPRNLIPVCGECNQRAKLDRDPIRDHESAPMLGTFHPYASQARDHIEVRVSRAKANNAPTVRILEAGALTPRVQSLIDVWDLQERWKGRLHDIIETVREIVAQMADDHERTVSEEEFQAALEAARQRRASRVGARPNRILECAYLVYVAAEPSELKTYYRLYQAQRANR